MKQIAFFVMVLLVIVFSGCQVSIEGSEPCYTKLQGNYYYDGEFDSLCVCDGTLIEIDDCPFDAICESYEVLCKGTVTGRQYVFEYTNERGRMEEMKFQSVDVLETFCNSLNEGYTHDRCIFKLADISGREELCEQLPGYQQEYGYDLMDQCIHGAALAQEDPLLCEKTNTPSECMIDIAKRTKNAALCDGLPEERDPNYPTLSYRDRCLEGVQSGEEI